MSTPESPKSPPSRPLIREPRLAPVIGRDAHLPAIAPERLTPDALRARFAPTLRAPAHAADGAGATRLAARVHRRRPAPVRAPAAPRRGAGAAGAPAAGPDGAADQRTDHLNDHAGQVSFPGGRTDPEDVDADRHRAARGARGGGPGGRRDRGHRRAAHLHHGDGLRGDAGGGPARPAARAGARCVRGGRGVRGAARLPDGSGQPSPPRGRVPGHRAPVHLDALGRRRAAASRISSGAPRPRCCATCTASWRADPAARAARAVARSRCGYDSAQ